MGLFSRKKNDEEFEKLPELPQLPQMPQLPESVSSQNLQSSQIDALGHASSLPSFSQAESARRWNMRAVKDAVGSSNAEERVVRDYGNADYDNVDDVSSGRGVMGTPRVPFNTGQAAPVPARREPLFVRIDKFEAALRDFEDISIKIKRIEELITEIRELREKEDREFGEWEKDLQVMKSRMDNIDRTLFSQMD